jgi:hypothetical protein
MYEGEPELSRRKMQRFCHSEGNSLRIRHLQRSQRVSQRAGKGPILR